MSRAKDLMRMLEQHGVSGVEKLIDEAASEQSFLDFKSVPDETLKGDTLKNLSRCLSGFANSEGGVVIWGVRTEKRDGVEIPVRGGELRDCHTFAKRLEEKVSGRTVPPVQGVYALALPIDSGSSGYVALYVPRGDEGPYQIVDDSRYLVRVGSTFQPIGHTVLAGMFGRSPQPAISLNYIVSPVQVGTEGGFAFAKVMFGLAVVNFGAVVAKDCFLSWTVRDTGGKRCDMKVHASDSTRWETDCIHPQVGSSIAVDRNRLAPGAIQRVVEFQLTFRRPLDGGFELDLSVGCTGAPIQKMEYRVAPAALEAAFADAVAARPDSDLHGISASLCGLTAHWTRQ